VRLYLDFNATAPIRAEVADAVSVAMRSRFGNPSSVHRYGQEAKTALDDARTAVARLIGANAPEVVFTSGGTESDNTAIRAAADAFEPKGRRHLIATAIEHDAVLATFKALETRGWRTTLLPVGPSGVVDPASLERVIGPDTALVSVMLANNELGTIQPVAALAAIARAHGALVHTDAVQAAGRIPVRVTDLGVDLLSISGHKFGAPKGVGALWVRRGLVLRPWATGGRQERGRRAGTENVPALEGFGVAARLAYEDLAEAAVRMAARRDRLEAALLAQVPGSAVNGGGAPRVPNTTNISFDRVEGESLVIGLDLEGIAVSTGSACSSGSLEPSHVLRAMGLPPHRVQSAIRFSLGPDTTDDDIDRTVDAVGRVVARLRAVGGGRG
jgi:cysteine desulfurase